jgi:hypothetical protein
VKKIFFSAALVCLTRICFSQGNILLLPFVGTDNSEVIRVFNHKTGISREWYYDNSLKKMNKSSEGFQLPKEISIKENVRMKIYIGFDGSEVLLIWNSGTGQSESWYYDLGEKKLKKGTDGYQLPVKIGLNNNIMMYPFIGADGSEVILCWETNTGKSISYYYDKAAKKFQQATSNYQLPVNTGVTGKVMMHPYIGADKSEVVLVWDLNTGKSISWYYSDADKKYMRSTANYQLPENLGLGADVMLYPYIGNDGSEVVLSWSISNGTSVMWYFENSLKKYQKATKEYQLPQATGITNNVMMAPFIVKNKDEVIYIWDSSTGTSVNYYFDNASKKYKKSEANYQLPANPLSN